MTLWKGSLKRLQTDGVQLNSFCFSDEHGFTPSDMIGMLGEA